MQDRLKGEQQEYPELTLSSELEAQVQRLISVPVGESPLLKDCSSTIFIPIEDGELRCFHYVPPQKIGRPIVFISGWGTFPEEFHEFFQMLHDRFELYYIETREKGSSRLKNRRVAFSMQQKAKDIQDALDFLELSRQDHVLVGSCWGGAIILKGLMEGVLTAPTVVTFDPMHTLWFSKFFLKYLSPLIPVWAMHMLRPLLKRVKLAGMKEAAQRARAERFIDDAVVWKWKRAAESVRDFELFGSLHLIDQEVFVVNGTGDKIHDQRNYPRMAREMPRGRFIYMRTHESEREKLLGFVVREFARVTYTEGLPARLEPFEKRLVRDGIDDEYIA